jgi:hypothetical protein
VKPVPCVFVVQVVLETRANCKTLGRNLSLARARICWLVLTVFDTHAFSLLMKRPSPMLLSIPAHTKGGLVAEKAHAVKWSFFE